MTPVTSRRASATETLWYTRCPVPTASSVAISHGWLGREFARDGISVLSLRANDDQEGRQAHYTHDHPALFREGGVVPPLWSYAAGRDLRLIGLGWIEQFEGLIALPGAGITEPGQLRGKRVALARRPDARIDFAAANVSRKIDLALRSVGLQRSDVEITEVVTHDPYLTTAPPSSGSSLYTARENARAQTAELLALVRGEVDVVFTSGGYGLQLAATIDAEVIVDLTPRRDGFRPNHLRVLTVSGELLAERPDLVARYIATLLRAAHWAAEHRDDTWRVIAAELGLAEEWARLGHHPELVTRLAPEISDDLLAELQQRANYFAANGFLEHPVDVATWLDPAPLAEARQLVGQA
jgi:ABC-type nitrate/sulfonate/bicarbonate transport system substrate-binding protein